MFSILIVEDDENVRNLTRTVLAQNGFETLQAKDGIEALDVMEKHHVDLALVDLMMPRMDGYELTEHLRSIYPLLPILMITAKQEAESMHKEFLVGTDDYLTKPVDDEEMILRIRALLRRAEIASERKLAVGSTVLDYDSLTVTCGSDESETLPQKEFYLLFKLLSYPGTIFTRMQLMDEIWGYDSETSEHTLNVHINRLRDRFRDNKDFEIVTVRGLGYKAVRHHEIA